MPSRVLGPNRTHGTISTYRCGCRCPECRRAAREHRARFRTHTKRYRPEECLLCGGTFYMLANHLPTCKQEYGL